MLDRVTSTIIGTRVLLGALLTDERGEGVISTAIAVLIMALIGAAMWAAFNGVWTRAEGQIDGAINQIGG